MSNYILTAVRCLRSVQHKFLLPLSHKPATDQSYVSLIQITCCYRFTVILSGVTLSCLLTCYFRYSIDCLLVLLPCCVWGQDFLRHSALPLPPSLSAVRMVALIARCFNSLIRTSYAGHLSCRLSFDFIVSFTLFPSYLFHIVLPLFYFYLFF
jgi:hypothetical protein